MGFNPRIDTRSHIQQKKSNYRQMSKKYYTLKQVME